MRELVVQKPKLAKPKITEGCDKYVGEAIETVDKSCDKKGGEPTLSRRTVTAMNPKSLKAALKRLGLSCQGNKRTLRTRLLETIGSA